MYNINIYNNCEVIIMNENEIREKYLPVGSVCLLKGASKKLMISGFCAVDSEEPDKIYDYSGCMYPEGFLKSDQTALFNHDQIEKVYHIGYVDEEEVAFKKDLLALVNEYNSKNADSPVGQTVTTNNNITADVNNNTNSVNAPSDQTLATDNGALADMNNNNNLNNTGLTLFENSPVENSISEVPASTSITEPPAPEVPVSTNVLEMIPEN